MKGPTLLDQWDLNRSLYDVYTYDRRPPAQNIAEALGELFGERVTVDYRQAVFLMGHPIVECVITMEQAYRLPLRDLIRYRFHRRHRGHQPPRPEILI